jgi:hypothetical protein
MKARILGPEEWDRLKGQDLPALLAYVEPQNAAVVVVEDDAGQVVASVCAMRVTHFEGLWIAPEHRGNAGTFRALIRQAFAIPRARGESWAFGGAADADEQMDEMCRRLGGHPLPVKFYPIPVGA